MIVGSTGGPSLQQRTLQSLCSVLVAGELMVQHYHRPQGRSSSSSDKEEEGELRADGDLVRAPCEACEDSCSCARQSV